MKKSAFLTLVAALAVPFVSWASEISEASLTQLAKGDTVDEVRTKLGDEEPCEVVLGFMIYKDSAKKDGRFFVFFTSEPQQVWFVARADSQRDDLDQVAVVWPSELKGQRVDELLRKEKERRANQPVDPTEGTRPAIERRARSSRSPASVAHG